VRRSYDRARRRRRGARPGFAAARSGRSSRHRTRTGKMLLIAQRRNALHEHAMIVRVCAAAGTAPPSASAGPSAADTAGAPQPRRTTSAAMQCVGVRAYSTATVPLTVPVGTAVVRACRRGVR
jgi:hypothetical protein